MQNKFEALLLERLNAYKLAPWQIRMGLGILQGLSNKEIADRLGIKEKTIKCNINRVYKKAKANNRSHFIAMTYQRIIEIHYLPGKNNDNVR
jgi:DNA-binding NarL/FixJ family response regulator